jgi:hypothetical protein
MLALSIFMGYELSKNMRKDSSVNRGRLTKEYKKIKDIKYNFDEKRGHRLYQQMCSKCHNVNLNGIGNIPSLKTSQYIKDNRFVKILTNGLNGQMPGFSMIPNKDLSHIINYVKSFQNLEIITPIQIIDIKLKFIERSKHWTTKDLVK